MKELIKQSFHLWIKKRWLKFISKEVDKYNKYNHKLNTQVRIIRALLKRYNEIYGEELRVSQEDQ